MRSSISIILFLLLLFFSSFSNGDYFSRHNSQRNNQAVLLESVKAITLENGKYTAGNKPIPQLKCVGGSAESERSLYPDVVQCVNVGSDSNGAPQWRCEADLDTSVRFGKTRVSCEGYSHPNDPYIWKGSCGLEYTLEYTEQGKHRRSHSYYESPHQQYSYYSSSSKYFNQSSFGSFVLFVIILIIIFGILSQLRYTQHNGPIPPPNTHYGTGPNPYPHDPYYGGSSYYEGYRPGFWSGFGGGSLLGYLLGRNTYYHRPAFGGYYGGHSGYYGGNSGFSNSSPSSPRGSTTRTATSYASTDRR